MVRLDRITTRTGDGGETSLADGTRVPKNSPRVAAYGTVDELNCLLGQARLEVLPTGLAEHLLRLQQELFEVGADLATPPGTAGAETRIPRIGPEQVAWLEAEIARTTGQLAPLTSFILPGGSRAAAILHLARAVARRAERVLLEALQAEGAAVPQRFHGYDLIYLNRLSDLLFVWARLCNDGGRADVLWQPGQER
jgi:cob(I)alamin adenosyltransferase